jgi:hypothetical protein
MKTRIIGRRSAALLGAATLAAAGSSGAFAGQAGATALGPWNQVANAGLENITEVGLARTADGVLHAAWSSQQSDNTQSIDTLPISQAGSLGSARPVVSGWASTDNPAVGLTPGGGLQVFFGGIHTLAPNDPNGDENLASSSDGGTTWAVTPADVVAPAASAYASQVSVSNSFAPEATPFETWTGTSGAWVHAGTDSGTPNYNFQTALGGCCGYYASVATDGSGNNELAWYSNATGNTGLFAQAVSAGGAPSGSPQEMPGTANFLAESQKVALLPSPHGGFYVVAPIGYPSFNAVELWKIGGGTIKVGGSTAGSGLVGAGGAIDQAGRVWAFWSRNIGDKPQLFAARSNPSVTKFGAVVAVGAPTGAASTYALDGNAAAGALDLFATTTDGSGNAAIWTRHVYPGLTLGVSPAAAKLHHKTKVTALVTDAGVPVKGATVKLGSHSGKTNAAGKVVFHLKVGGSLAGVASDAGYVNATAELHAAR